MLGPLQGEDDPRCIYIFSDADEVDLISGDTFGPLFDRRSISDFLDEVPEVRGFDKSDKSFEPIDIIRDSVKHLTKDAYL